VSRCNGLGSKYDFDPARVIVDWTRPLFDGALGPGSGSALLKRTIELGAYAHGFDLQVPFEKQPTRVQNLILYGWPPSNGRAASATVTDAKAKKFARKRIPLPRHSQFLDRNFQESNSDSYREWMTQYMSATLCSVCHGKRLRPSPWP